MSFSGFNNGGDNLDYNNASLKSAKPAKGLKGKKINHHSVLEDPASAMMPEETAPITEAQIRRAKQQRERANRPKKAAAKPVAKKSTAEIDWHDNEASSPSPTPQTSTEPQKVPEKESPPDEKMDILTVQKKQKELENENKLRRQALATEVQNRSRKILDEAAKLKKIESEIKKLDELLSYDVSILRDKIDTASYEYSKTRARFVAAELEFKESKKEFEEATTKKDDLTQALMTLIQENEERKKVKLENLVARLNMNPEELAQLEKEEAEAAKKKAEEMRLAAEKRKLEEEEEKKRLEKEAEEKAKQEAAAAEEKKAEGERAAKELAEKALAGLEEEAKKDQDQTEES